MIRISNIGAPRRDEGRARPRRKAPRGAFRALAAALATVSGLAQAPLAAADAPLRFRHKVEAGDGSVPISMELYLDAVNDDVIAVKVAGDLGALQPALPGMLSRVVEDTCRRRIGVEVQDVHAEGDGLRVSGRVQIISYRCRNPDDLESRVWIFSNITEFDALLAGHLENNCLGAELRDLSVSPRGLIGGVINLLGLSPRIAARVREAINDGLREEVKCIDLPEKLRIIDTHLASGGFRDFGEGKMGFVVRGTIDVRARNVIALITALAREGELRD